MNNVQSLYMRHGTAPASPNDYPKRKPPSQRAGTAASPWTEVNYIADAPEALHDLQFFLCVTSSYIAANPTST